jgi:poly(3-hydroxybutyrate) depolymerase
MALPRIFAKSLLLLLLAALPGGALQSEPLPAGKSRFTVTTTPVPIEVFAYRPAHYVDGPLLVVMHGLNCNAEDYRNYAIPLADRCGALVIAPLFDTNRFPSEAYQRGGILKKGQPQPREQWTFSYLPQLVAAVRAREGKTNLPYYLIGHSAGGQFLTRLAAFAPGDAQRIVAGNPGSHLFPTRDLPFQYGFGELPPELGDDAAIQRYLAAPLTLFLGTADTGSKNLDETATAMKQGATRIERGRRCYEMARELAAKRGWKFGWSVVEAPGIGHDAAKLFAHPLAEKALLSAQTIREADGNGRK